MTTTSGRLLSLLSLLQTRRDWPGEVLATRLEVSPRTVRRDIDRLREIGYRIDAFKGPAGGYRLDAGADLPPLLFDDDQAVALAVSLQVTATTGAGLDERIGEAALRALTTLRQVMPSRVRHRLDALPLAVVEPRADADEVDRGVLLAVGGAVHAREVLRFDYGEDSRRAEAHHLVLWRGRWYLVGWDLDRDDWRTYRVDRISPRVPNGPRFGDRELPGGDVATFVTGRFRGSEATAGWPCTGEVVVHLPLDRVRPFTSTGFAEQVGTDRTRLGEGSWSWPSLAASLCRFDADLDVVGPRELKEALKVLSDRAGRAASPGPARS
ncbi:DeoR family transcriptional regulator [Aeromicrobium flavum]|uniref:DeoR family transcriptional regulator n=1 Tax=Aeromicrobium flavum TaxID=416568 RepID=A0A512HVW7_9ACTN|nr:WYL domain-containing protein [Aeromicrobium flavum]GEO89596.1 DeoR family transcriptional regulator [Aeromicrobium flavum]